VKISKEHLVEKIVIGTAAFAIIKFITGFFERGEWVLGLGALAVIVILVLYLDTVIQLLKYVFYAILLVLAIAIVTQALPDNTSPASPPTWSPAVAIGTPAVDISPEQAVTYYYQMINNRQYSTTWVMLSDKFKVEHSPDFQDYVAWWDSVERVDVRNVTIVGGIPGQVVALADLYYLTKGNWIHDDKPYIQLVFDESTHAWLFNAKGPTPYFGD
jgi:hypothetical protein